jgi:hypothetical protein
VSDSETVTLHIKATVDQLREVNRRAGLGALNGKTRGEYLVGCATGEPHDDLIARVAAIRDSERERFRAEIQTERAERARKASPE